MQSSRQPQKKIGVSNKELISTSHADITASVLEEVRERESRRNNLIIHYLPEPGLDITESKERITKDIEKVQELFELINVDVVVKDCSRFTKRLGQRDDENETPRPLLIGFRSADYSKAVLEKSSTLAEKGEPWSNINIIQDLTKTQRKEERKMREDADAKNALLDEAEKENWQWKVVGRRGERKVIKTAVKQEEGESMSARRDLRRRGPKTSRK